MYLQIIFYKLSCLLFANLGKEGKKDKVFGVELAKTFGIPVIGSVPVMGYASSGLPHTITSTKFVLASPSTDDEPITETFTYFD